MSEPTSSLAPPFSDPRNINVGKARVIWVKGHCFESGGWVLPGGGKTTDEDEALRVAVAMHQLMG